MKHYIHFTNEQDKENVTSELRCLVKAAVYSALAYEDFQCSAEISVTFTDNEGIREKNREFRGIDSATDVLSFPMYDIKNGDTPDEFSPCELGDIVLSLERAAEQATEFGHSYERECAFLTVHSVLHLLGYDHVNGGIESVRMREKEETVLTKLGLKRNSSYYMDDENV
jgi:probable rRNA maturation factor